nr:MAG TPA: outer membrane protein assembly factor [Caudoviricetes sp.]
MKKPLVVIALAACAAALTGCKSVEVDRKGQALATVKHADGTVEVVRDTAGRPLVLDGGWRVDYFQHWNWQRFDNLEAKAGEAELRINNYEGGADATNLTQLVHTSLEGLTKLVATAADAYVKVAGGGAQADTALNAAKKMIEYFAEKGGDVSKATVTTDTASNTVKVSDGATCISCDAAGNCTDCTAK